MPNSENSIDAQLTSKIREKVADLKETFNKIEEEFKRKGESGVMGHSWYRYSGILFDAKKYATLTNSLLCGKALEIVEILCEVFPYIPHEDIRRNIKMNELIKYDNVQECCYFYPLRSPFFESTPISSLIGLCEGLDRPEVVRELQKPLYVALAYIFSRKKDSFSKSDFPELKPTVFDCAVDLALKKGWITEAEQKGVYKINEKPEFSIKCPACMRIVSAYTEYCPKCGLYLLNMATNDQKPTEDDVPAELFLLDQKENKWVAYFHFKKPNTTIETSDDSLPLPYYYNPDILLFSVLEDAVKSGYASKIPDYISYAKCYTQEFGFLAYAHEYEGYYKSVGETIEEVRGKLVAINNLMKNKIEAEYDSHKDSFLFGKYANRKNDFIKEVLRVCQACFTPKLHEHPIFQAKEVPIKSLICPNCGSKMPFYAKYCGHCGYELSSVKLFG